MSSRKQRRRGAALLLILGLYFFRNHYFTGNDGRDMNEKSPLPKPVAVVPYTPNSRYIPGTNYNLTEANHSFVQYIDSWAREPGLAAVLGEQ